MYQPKTIQRRHCVQGPTMTGALVTGRIVVAGVASEAVTVNGPPVVPNSRPLASANVAVPLTIDMLSGKKAPPAVVVRWIESPIPLTICQVESHALTMTVVLVLTLCSVGVPT